jgi:hypothetical protein
MTLKSTQMQTCFLKKCIAVIYGNNNFTMILVFTQKPEVQQTLCGWWQCRLTLILYPTCMACIPILFDLYAAFKPKYFT